MCLLASDFICAVGRVKAVGLTNPVVHPEVGDHIEQHHIPAANHLPTEHKQRNHSRDARIAEHNKRQLLFLVQHAVLAEVEVRELWEALVVLLPSQVRK